MITYKSTKAVLWGQLLLAHEELKETDRLVELYEQQVLLTGRLRIQLALSHKIIGSLGKHIVLLGDDPGIPEAWLARADDEDEPKQRFRVIDGGRS